MNLRYLMAAVAALTLIACGGGGDAASTREDLSAKAKPPTGSTAWQPPAGATPASGNYVYLESQTGDPVGVGQRYLYQHANALIKLAASTTRLDVQVDGAQRWAGLNVEPANRSGRLVSGVFTGQGAATLSWRVDGRACASSSGWLAVDAVSYAASGSLSAVTLRFEQRCEGASAPLRGKLRWAAQDVQPVAGPQPLSAILPGAFFWASGPVQGVAGNHLALVSFPDDVMGTGMLPVDPTNGLSWEVYAVQAGSRIRLTETPSAQGAMLDVEVSALSRSGALFTWRGSMRAMLGQAQWVQGYYPRLTMKPASGYHNPATGGLHWQVDTRTCDQAAAELAIDQLTRDASGQLQTVWLRFAQVCNPPSEGQLFGKLIWSAEPAAAP